MHGGVDDVVNLDSRREPDDYSEGYFVFEKINENIKPHFRDEEKDSI